MLSEQEILRRVSEIPGPIHSGELLVIYHICAELLESCSVVEIGTGLGRSTVVLSSIVSSKGGLLYTVDNYSEFEGWKRWVRNSGNKKLNVQIDIMEDIRQFLRKTLADFLHCIRFYECSSSEASKQVDAEVDAIWIDGGHSYEDVKTDLRSWLPKLKVGGIVFGHDFDLLGVVQAVCEEVEMKFQTINDVLRPVFTDFRTFRDNTTDVSRIWFAKRFLEDI